MFKQLKKKMLKELDNTTGTEELVFELNKWKKFFRRTH